MRTDVQPELTDVKNAGHELLSALAAGQHALQSHAPCGPISALVALILERPTPSPTSHVLIVAAVGSCSAFVFSPSTQTVSEVAPAPLVMARADPGGSLGTVLPGNCPDLRNLRVVAVNVGEGDVVLVGTGGLVHNLSPANLGLIPRDLANLASSDPSDLPRTWNPPTPVLQDLSSRYRSAILAKLFGDKDGAKQQMAALSTHCETVTQRTRDHVGSDPLARIPRDAQRFGGVLDHVAAVVAHVRKGQ